MKTPNTITFTSVALGVTPEVSHRYFSKWSAWLDITRGQREFCLVICIKKL